MGTLLVFLTGFIIDLALILHKYTQQLKIIINHQKQVTPINKIN